MIHEITSEEHRRSVQFNTAALACEWYWSEFSKHMTPIVERCQDLADKYVPGLWDQWREDLVNAPEFLNRLQADMIACNSPTIVYACAELLHRMNSAAAKFKRQITPLATELDVPIEMTGEGSYNYCHRVGISLAASIARPHPQG